ncbi:hypothetical protein MNBD_BACTEROID03-2587, partial [hydrothermal vent metagenome]
MPNLIYKVVAHQDLTSFNLPAVGGKPVRSQNKKTHNTNFQLAMFFNLFFVM